MPESEDIDYNQAMLQLSSPLHGDLSIKVQACRFVMNSKEELH